MSDTDPSATSTGPQDHREVEWQFDAVDLRPVQRWLSDRGAEARPSVGPGPVREHVDIYWDTEDWRLYGAGWSLRTREAGVGIEATMKSLSDRAGSETDRRDRRELSATVSDDGPDGLLKAPEPLGDRIRALAGTRGLRRLFEVRTRRRVFPVTVDGRQVAELALDDTAIPVPPDDRPVRLQRVEVEMTGEGGSDLSRFVHELRSACGLTPAAGPKFETGLLVTGMGPPPPPDLGPTEIDEGKSVGEVAFAVLRSQFAAFLAAEPGSRLGEDPEEIHDMRVAIRRMRAAIRLFGDALPVRAQSLSRELKWVAGSLGAVRDLDVQLERFAEWSGQLSPEDREALRRVVDVLRTSRAAARRRLLRTLDSKRYERLISAMAGMLQRGPLRRSPRSRTPAVMAGSDIVRRAHRKMRRAGDSITEQSSPADLHRLRIRGKRARYAVESLEPVYGKPARRLIQRLKAMQDVLGLYQDAQVAMRHLRELVRERGVSLEPQALFVLGLLAQRYGAQAEEQRSLLASAYRRARGKAWRRLRGAMDERRSEAEGRLQRRPPPPPDRTAGAAEQATDASAVPA
jgi:CHAD domain-containing protein